MQNADGKVLIRAELDTASVTAGIAEMRAALDALKSYAARQSASIRSQVQTEGKTLNGMMPGLASGLIGALASGLSGGGGRIAGALRGVLSSALSTGGEYAQRFSGIGYHVISGIINGIRGSASSLWNTLREVAANMVNTLKASLGIRSPSQIMREEVGEQIGAGLAQGMLDSRGQIASASAALAAEAVVPRGSLPALSVGAAGAMLHSGTAIPSSVRQGTVRAAGQASGASQQSEVAPVMGGNTFIFQKPVETPYRHAQAIREVMEEMLYGT